MVLVVYQLLSQKFEEVNDFQNSLICIVHAQFSQREKLFARRRRQRQHYMNRVGSHVFYSLSHLLFFLKIF